MLSKDAQNTFLAAKDHKALLSDVEPGTVTVDWQAHLEVLPLASWIADFDGGEIFVNKACRELLGVPDFGKVNYRGWGRFVHPDDRDEYIKAWDLFITGFAARFREIVRWIRPDNGQIIKVAVRAQKLRCGQVQGWIRSAHIEQALSKLEELAYVRIQ